MTLDLAALALQFAQAEALGVKLDGFLATFVEANPEFAPDVDKLRAALKEATDAGNILPVVSEALAGALKALLAGHGEPGRHSAHLG